MPEMLHLRDLRDYMLIKKKMQKDYYDNYYKSLNELMMAQERNREEMLYQDRISLLTHLKNENNAIQMNRNDLNVD